MHIAGSIYPTVVAPSRLPLPAPSTAAPARSAEAEEEITSVCLASASDADQCEARMDAASGQAQHMAYCDVDDVGFAQCLSRYSRALVRHPAASRRSLQVAVLNSQGQREMLTVLATAAASNEQISAAIRKGRPDVAIVAMP
ncbi:hypothetical protein [Dyella acidiphila]|uniref:Uncharacterized protein n=1 Tax=Dyella acidiphila TaxID=2775866 RepID=A0ABR9GEM5_9GAMM|nr:hypothetical protein [Dyella acidiphila]MBE1162506.1 hypothetical protein [Dyella acidiphila]